MAPTGFVEQRGSPPVTPAARKRTWRKRRRFDSKCMREGCPVISGDESRCEEHAEEHAAWMRGHRECLEPGCEVKTGSRGWCATHKEARARARKTAP